MSNATPALVERLLAEDRTAHEIEDLKRPAPPPLPVLAAELTPEQMSAVDETMEFAL